VGFIIPTNDEQRDRALSIPSRAIPHVNIQGAQAFTYFLMPSFCFVCGSAIVKSLAPNNLK
jgi:hypothetical protein